ncbi:hypothetical protein F4809DRAFT_646769 [Biscogniauxia mediterranea]|nr:hypothetical protein F4809DRAFT_646769 [Biscogniauxia mediterranea]
MSLARAFTTRRKQSSVDLTGFSFPQRSNTTAKGSAHSASIRTKISSPMELTHTTNMLAYNAPDLFPQPGPSPVSSSKSDDETSDTPSTTASTPPTSPDMPSVENRPRSPEPNHLSCYFSVSGQKQSPNAPEAPSIPKRAPSHTKKASFENFANRFSPRNSNQSNSTTSSTKSSLGLSRSSSTSTTATTASARSHSHNKPITPTTPLTPSVTSPPATRPNFRRHEYTESQHPFGKELAQVSELAEELGIKEKLQAIDEEEQQLVAKGLCRFQPEDYLAEISGLVSSYLRPERPSEAQAIWI